MFEQPQKKETVQRRPANKTGMPDSLKSGIEALSGMSMDSVRVHYNSSEPARLGALAYTMGNDIHISSGMERHLPHEAWHVVQQMRGIVRPTVNIDGTAVNDEPSLEREAEVMGSRAAQMKTAQCSGLVENMGGRVAQRYTLPENRKFSSVNRRLFQPADGDGLGDTETLTVEDDEGQQTTVQTQRDHIIPMNTIRKFADEIFSSSQNPPAQNPAENPNTPADEWLKKATENFLTRGDGFATKEEKSKSSFYLENVGSGFYQTNIQSKMDNYIDSSNAEAQGLNESNCFDILLKAISWMPGNIFMAPHPKEGDMGAGFDITARTVMDGEKYKKYKETYEHMSKFISARDKRVPEAAVNKNEALIGLKDIAGESNPWKYDPNQWTYQKGTKTFKANVVGDPPQLT